MSNKALLMILDGWGIGDHTKCDAISCANTTYWDSLMKNYPHSQLSASGESVGLPDGQTAKWDTSISVQDVFSIRIL